LWQWDKKGFDMLETTLEKPKTKAKVKAAFNLPRQGEWTREHWLNFPNDGWKYEIINGVLYMSPAPAIAHQDSFGELFTQMRVHARKNNLGKVLAAPTDVYLPGQPVPVQPDILFVKKERLDIIAKDAVYGVPDLAVEILSPSNESYDRTTKMKLYEQVGVPEYWMLTYWRKTLEVYELENGVYKLVGKYQAGEVARSAQIGGFEVAVEALFA
jgi:Uma2 family endonuclease